jgi:hypothetical protein
MSIKYHNLQFVVCTWRNGEEEESKPGCVHHNVAGHVQPEDELTQREGQDGQVQHLTEHSNLYIHLLF